MDEGDFVRNISERKRLDEILCPIDFGNSNNSIDTNNRIDTKPQAYPFKAYHVIPCDVYVLNERDDIVKSVMLGDFGNVVNLSVTEIDYMTVARRIIVSDSVASIPINGAYKQEDIVTDLFINSASNGSKIMKDLLDGITIPYNTNVVNFKEWANSEPVQEASFMGKLFNKAKNGKSIDIEDKDSGEDFIYSWLDSYFALPEGEDMKQGGREVVPLLIGPTGVFKSATVKDLCRKYDYRLVDFRVSFTSRLDYSGLFQMGDVDGKKYSYACPMEELVTCSDGFREYCRKAYDKVSQILTDGYIVKDSSSDGQNVTENTEALTDEQREELKTLLESYKEYMKTPVLFFDEITRCKDAGVNGVLVTLLNQKKFNNMTLNGCKFVAATNLNLMTSDDRHNRNMDELDEMYDVNTDLDVAYSNRFMPLKVLPEAVAGRWYSWAEGEKKRNGKTVKNIHPIVIEFLHSPEAVVNGQSLLYNDTPVLDAIEKGLTENEQKSQTFPNYRTWEMLSDYMYSIDEEYEIASKDNENAVKSYRETIMNGLISEWAAKPFIKFIKGKGYKPNSEINGEPDDDVGDFLESTLGAGVPALMIGPSSLGKTSRVKAYMKKVEKRTGVKPVLININLSSMDTVDLMGMPTKTTLVDYVGGKKLNSKGLGVVGKALGDIVKDVCKDDSYGLVDTLTQRAPDKTIKDRFKKALDEGREVILFFDECNRVKSTTIMSAMFNAISDYEFAGVSFKAQKDRVKVIAACNMAHSEMDKNVDWGEVGDYGDAGSLDPALAARFSVYWKKNYDEKDVKSWINFMEDMQNEGEIDGTLLEFFKSLSTDKAIKVMASVEKRKIQDAESSTRAMLQLSKDIKSMRGRQDSTGFHKSLYNGKVIFDDALINEFANINVTAVDGIEHNTAQSCNEVMSFIKKIINQSSTWEPLLVGQTVNVDGEDMTASDAIDTLKEIYKTLGDYLLKPTLTKDDKNDIKAYVQTALAMVEACSRMDNSVKNKRADIFESYVGREFAQEFLPFFNQVFGSQDDVEITIEMLEDDSLIEPFLRRKRSMMTSLTSDQAVDSMLKLIKDFWDVHSNRLPSKNYSEFLTEIGNSLPSSDSLAELLSRSGKELDGFYTAAEGSGDAWIMSILKAYPARFTKEDIDNMRAAIQSTTSNKKSRRTRIL